MGSLRMQTLNIEVARKHAVDFGGSSASAPLTGGGTSTPLSLNTPDILNSLISITSNPFFDSSIPPETSSGTSSYLTESHLNQNGDDDKKVFATLETPTSTSVSGQSTILQSPPYIIVSPPPQTSTVQSLRSQFIKDSLKLTIQTKRKSNGKGEFDVQAELEVKVRKKEEVDLPNSTAYFHRYAIANSIETTSKLTPEDEERRKRRRERNKVAATKCRNKKKEKTGLLVQESHSLEINNVTLKSEISKLEEERLRLMEVLAAHAPTCHLKSMTNDTHSLRSNHLNTGSSYNNRDFMSPSPYYHVQQTTRTHMPAQRT